MGTTDFRLKREYAEVVADRWYILSAKHGVVEPHEELANYNLEITDRVSEEYREEAGDDLDALRSLSNAHVQVLAGKRYVESVAPLLDERASSWDTPTGGLGIGERMAWLSEHTPGGTDATAAGSEGSDDTELVDTNERADDGREAPDEMHAAVSDSEEMGQEFTDSSGEHGGPTSSEGVEDAEAA